MFSHLIFAGGKGSRLFLDRPGCKALIPIREKLVLIDYCLEELRQLSVDERIVLISPGICTMLKEKVAEYRPQPRVMSKAAGGTGKAVEDLLSATQASLIAVMPGDIVGERDALRNFYREATSRIGTEQTKPICYIAAAAATEDESEPVYIHHAGGDAVSTMGKNLPATTHVWIGVRMMNAAFARLLRSAWEPGLVDEEVMTRTIRRHPRTVFSIPAPTLFDVDDHASCSRARSVWV
jgi:choline kinase